MIRCTANYHKEDSLLRLFIIPRCDSNYTSNHSFLFAYKSRYFSLPYKQFYHLSLNNRQVIFLRLKCEEEECE